MSRLLHRAINLLPVVGFAALWVLDSALIAGVTLFGAALTVFAFDARTKHAYQSATINRMLDSVPGLEETVLAGVKVDADVLFQFKLGGPPCRHLCADAPPPAHPARLGRSGSGSGGFGFRLG